MHKPVNIFLRTIFPPGSTIIYEAAEIVLQKSTPFGRKYLLPYCTEPVFVALQIHNSLHYKRYFTGVIVHLRTMGL